MGRKKIEYESVRLTFHVPKEIKKDMYNKIKPLIKKEVDNFVKDRLNKKLKNNK